MKNISTKTAPKDKRPPMSVATGRLRYQICEGIWRGIGLVWTGTAMASFLVVYMYVYKYIYVYICTYIDVYILPVAEEGAEEYERQRYLIHTCMYTYNV